MKQYKITCLSCDGSNIALIFPAEDSYVIDLNNDHRKTGKISIISSRYRKDLKFGWECICGNTSLLSRLEAPEARSLVSGGGEQALNKLMDSLKESDEKKFAMEEI